MKFTLIQTNIDGVFINTVNALNSAESLSQLTLKFGNQE